MQQLQILQFIRQLNLRQEQSSSNLIPGNDEKLKSKFN